MWSAINRLIQGRDGRSPAAWRTNMPEPRSRSCGSGVVSPVVNLSGSWVTLAKPCNKVRGSFRHNAGRLVGRRIAG